MRLSTANLAALASDASRGSYDRDDQAVGIVHFGIGAFHRAHQAWYTDFAMDAGDRGWAISGVSLRSEQVASQLNPQDGLYTVCERSDAGLAVRLVGSVREVLVAGRDTAAVSNRLASAKTRIVSFTVTEKGYCRAPDGSLDFAKSGEASFYPILAAAFRARRDGRAGGLTLISCDNLEANGRQLDRLLREYLHQYAPDLVDWFDAECRCPSTMVDRIVPASTDEDRAALQQVIGLADEAAVFTEPFSQWVIEDRFATPRPSWHNVGAQIVDDVAPYETAKLRMLNGAHSALAYLGLERGHDYVHEVIADPTIGPVVERLMRQEAAPTIDAGPAQDLDAYADALLSRFANPALQHRLAQIATDGTQKIPQRWLATLAEQQRRGVECPAIMLALGAFVRHLQGANVSRIGPVDDPLIGEIRQILGAGSETDVIQALFGSNGPLRSEWRPGD